MRIPDALKVKEVWVLGIVSSLIVGFICVAGANISEARKANARLHTPIVNAERVLKEFVIDLEPTEKREFMAELTRRICWEPEKSK